MPRAVPTVVLDMAPRDQTRPVPQLRPWDPGEGGKGTASPLIRLGVYLSFVSGIQEKRERETGGHDNGAFACPYCSHVYLLR